MRDDHFEVTLTLIVDLEKFTWIRVSQLPCLDAIVTRTVRWLVIEDEKMAIQEGVHWLLLIVLQIKFCYLRGRHTEDKRRFKLFSCFIILKRDLAEEFTFTKAFSNIDNLDLGRKFVGHVSFLDKHKSDQFTISWQNSIVDYLFTFVRSVPQSGYEAAN